MNEPGRRARLNSIKLTTLVREHLGGDAELTPGEFAGGAALCHGREAWVLLDQHPERGLGGALAWAIRREADALHVVAERATRLLARRAAGWSMPVHVWHADQRLLLPGVAEPLPAPLGPPARHLAFVDVITEGGATVVVEHGVLSGEIEGLEVCRVVDDPYTGDVRLEVGVGAHDREAFQMLHGDRPTAEALAVVVHAVATQRRPLDPRHPLGRLAPERTLRCRLVENPSLIGATSMVFAPPPVPRPNLKDPVPCVAEAVIGDHRTAVVCSVGVDLDAVPFCIDARLGLGVDDCLLVLPERDALDIQRRLAALAVPPVRIATVPTATFATA